MDTVQAFLLTTDDKLKDGIETSLLASLGCGVNFVGVDYSSADIGIVDMRSGDNSGAREFLGPLRLPIIFLTNGECEIDYKGHYRKVDLIQDTTELTQNLCISIEALVRNRLKRSPYAAVDINKVLQVNPLCPIFLRLSGDKFVKIRESVSDDLLTLDRYRERGVDHLYILQDDFLTYFFPVLEGLFKDFGSGNAEAGLVSLDQLRELVQAFGVKKDTVKLVDGLVAETLKSLEGKSKFKDLLHLAASKKGYLSLHAHLTSYFAVEIAKNLDWRTPDSYRKLVIASLFQNITLQTEDQAKVMRFSDEEMAVLTTEEKNLVKRHMISACDLLEPLPTFTSDVRNAILSHHERPDGSGYPRGLGARQLTQFEATFIIAVNAAHEIVISGNPRNNFKSVIEKFQGDFILGNFEKPCKSFMKVFLERASDR